MTDGNDRGRGRAKKVVAQKQSYRRRVTPYPTPPSSSSPSPSSGGRSSGRGSGPSSVYSSRRSPTAIAPRHDAMSPDQLSVDHGGNQRAEEEREVQRAEEEELQQDMEGLDMVQTEGSRNNRRRRSLSISGETFVPGIEGTKAVRDILLSHYKKFWPKWQMISAADKAIMFREFMRKNYVDCSNPHEIENVFYKRASAMLRNRLDKARRDRIQPLWIPDDVWEQLLAYWASDEFKKESEKNRASRRGGRATPAATHTGGSRSITQHRISMTEENGGIEPSPSDVFLRTHARQTESGTIYISDKAQTVYERYQEETVRSQSASNTTDAVSPAIDELRLVWTEVAGTVGGRSYGVGTDQPLYRPPGSTRVLRGSGSSSTEWQRRLESLTEENQALKDKVTAEEQRRMALEATIKEQQEMTARHDALLRQLLAANPDFFRNMGPAPSADRPPEDGGDDMGAGSH